MIKILSILMFILWLLGVFGFYSIGWAVHILLIVSIMLFFVSIVHNKNPEITEIMNNDNLSKEEAEQVKSIMIKNKLSEKEALLLLEMRSKYHPDLGDGLLKTEPKQIRKIMERNKVGLQEAIELLSFRLNLHHH